MNSAPRESVPGEDARDPSASRARRGCLRTPSRRTFLLGTGGALGVGCVGWFGLTRGLPRWLRAGEVRPLSELSSAAQELTARSLDGIDRSLLVDAHVHLVGLDRERNGTYVSKRMQSPWHPLDRLRFDIYLAAAGVREGEGVDAAYVDRLLALQRASGTGARLLLLAFDETVDENGTPHPEETAFHTPNEYVLRLAKDDPGFLAAASVHPYRTDALERLGAVARAGAVAIKWLPNAMGIDPAAKRLDAYYERMAELGLVLLTHTGEERAVGTIAQQDLGNPLRLRRAIEAGVRVIGAHCASLGEDFDLDRGVGADRGPRRSSFDLFLRMLAEEKSRGRLFGGISAVTQVNRPGRVLAELLRREEFHDRLVNGSDYPLPAIDPLVSTWQLVRRGFLEASERPALNEIFAANPLLFDFVLKRSLRLVEGGRTFRFAPVVFESGRIFLG